MSVIFHSKLRFSNTIYHICVLQHFQCPACIAILYVLPFLMTTHRLWRSKMHPKGRFKRFLHLIISLHSTTYFESSFSSLPMSELPFTLIHFFPAWINNLLSSPTTNTLINYNLISPRLDTAAKSVFKYTSLGDQFLFYKHKLYLMKLNTYLHFWNCSLIQNVFYFAVHLGKINMSAATWMCFFPLLKYKYNICYAPAVQQQEVFDVCFNILVHLKCQVAFLQSFEMETVFSVKQKLRAFGS